VVGTQMTSKMHKPAGLIVPHTVAKQMLAEGHLQQLDQLLGSWASKCRAMDQKFVCNMLQTGLFFS